MGAAGGEDAARDLLLQARHQPGDLGQPRLGAGERGAEPRHRAQQPLRIGMPRRPEQLPHRGLLHLLAGIHDHHPLGDLGDDAEVMGDEHDGRADPVLQVAHELEDLRLDGHVERRRRLVGDQQLRVAGQRDGDHHPLAHAARELVRILPHPPPRLRDADQGQHLDRLGLGVLGGEPLVQPQRLADLPADVQHRVERGHRLLEDHADLVAADVPHLRLREGQQVLALEADRPGDLARRLRDEPQDGHGGHGLAAAALAHDGQRLAGRDLEGHAIDRAVDPVRRAEMGLQVLDFEQCHGSRASLPCAGRARRAGHHPAG